MVREAGGICTDLAGGEKMLDAGAVLAGNRQIVAALRPLLASPGDTQPAATGPVAS